MNKDHIRDYATAAFRFWSGVGCPTYDEALSRIRAKAERRSFGADAVAAEAFVAAEIFKASATLLDVKACEETFAELKHHGKECVCSAVREIYMPYPRKKLAKGELSGRVVHFAMNNYYSERQVYYFLAEACEVFAEKRGLRRADAEL